MFEGVFVGDLHLDSCKFLSAYVENPDDLIYKALDNAVNYAQENGITNMILLGDIYDHPNPSQDSQKRLLRYLKATGLNVYSISGNHDRTSQNEHSLIMAQFHTEESSKRIRFYTDPEVVEIDGIDFCMMPWPATKTLLKGPGINVAHITLKGALSDAGRPLTKGEEFKFRTDQYWVIGDLHTRQKTKFVHYVGTMFQKNFGEHLPKGFSHITARMKNGKLKIEDRFIVTKPPFELVNLSIESLKDLDLIEDYDPHNIKLYKLKMKADIALPTTFRVDNPQVYDIDWGKRKRIVEKNGQKITISGISRPLKGLRTYLIKKEGLTKDEAQQAYVYAKSKLKEVEHENS